MPATFFYPMAPSDCLPKIVRRYHFLHGSPPSDPTLFMERLRRGLRGAKRCSIWGKLKSFGWRIRIKIDQCTAEHLEPLCPGFPVAPPSSPQIPSWLPDIQIMPVGSPEFKLSPPLPQVEGLLIVPGRGPTVRARRRSRQQSRPPLRPLPTPPGPPPPHAPPAISCCPWANDPSPKPQKSQPKLPVSDSNADDIAIAIFYADVAPFLFASEDASAGHQGTDESQQQNSSDTSTNTAYNDNASPPRGGVMTLSNTQAQEIRDVAADTEFLDELGLNTQAFKALLDGVDVQWNANQAGRD